MLHFLTTPHFYVTLGIGIIIGFTTGIFFISLLTINREDHLIKENEKLRQILYGKWYETNDLKNS